LGDNISVSLDASKDVQQPSLEDEAAKYEDPQTDEGSDEERPEWLPEKFKSAADMAKAYAELEKKMSSKRTLEVPEATNDKDGSDEVEKVEEPTTDEAAVKAVEDAGLNLSQLSQKFWDTGSIDEADYEAFDKKGIPKTLVDEYIDLKTQQFESSVVSAVGGKDQYVEMIGWAADNLKQNEIDTFNRAVNSGDLNMANMATKGLQARYKADAGFEPIRSVKGENVNAEAQTYRSLAELQKDMSDPRYQKDPAFRKDVERKLERSDII